MSSTSLVSRAPLLFHTFRRNSWTTVALRGLATSVVLLSASSLPAYEQPAEKEEFVTRLFIADSDGGNMKQLANLPEYQAQGSPAWSLDGKFIAFDAWKPQKGEDFSASQVIVVESDGGNPRVLGDGAMPCFSPEGHRIAFSGPKTGGTWIMGSRGPDDELLQLDDRGWGTDWSRDGRIVYSIRLEGGANLVVYNFVEGRTVLLFDRQKTPYRQIYWNMAWSPDSKRIVFKGMNTEGKIEVGIVDARGEKFGFVRRHEGNTIPASFAWNPEKPRILFVEQTKDTQIYQLFAVDPDTKDPPQLLPAQDSMRHYADIAYSPDGKKIVFSCQKKVAGK
jgi:Tol biopolymer transport system component